MMEGYSHSEEYERDDREDVHSKVVRAGKRTYFFDVKATRQNEYYLTITESKKRVDRDGKFFFEKHKIFLYKEDFDKFAEGLAHAVDYIRAHQPDEGIPRRYEEPVAAAGEELTSITFDDLGAR